VNEPPAAGGHRRRLAERLEAATLADDVDELIRVAVALANSGCRWAAAEAVQDALVVAPTRPDVHTAVVRIYRTIGWTDTADRHLELADRYARMVDHTDELDALADDAIRSGDVRSLVEVAARHARQRRLQPALDACFEAIRIAPADPDAHLTLARVRLALGWRRLVLDDIDRLGRLLDLTGDAGGRERLDDFVATELNAP
jgi:hypothetical protein